jgi:hypothetical protein
VNEVTPEHVVLEGDHDDDDDDILPVTFSNEHYDNPVYQIDGDWVDGFLASSGQEELEQEDKDGDFSFDSDGWNTCEWHTNDVVDPTVEESDSAIDCNTASDEEDTVEDPTKLEDTIKAFWAAVNNSNSEISHGSELSTIYPPIHELSISDYTPSTDIANTTLEPGLTPSASRPSQPETGYFRALPFRTPVTEAFHQNVLMQRRKELHRKQYGSSEPRWIPTPWP